MALICVKKENVTAPPAQAASGLDICLACWCDYMRTDDRDLGTSRMRLIGKDDTDGVTVHDADPYADQRKADMKIGEATDAMIDSLPRLYIWAIYKAHGFGQVWRFAPDDFGATLAAAKVALEKKLRGNSATGVKFG